MRNFHRMGQVAMLLDCVEISKKKCGITPDSRLSTWVCQCTKVSNSISVIQLLLGS